MIAWTYDPLIRRNAYFNLVKLGARPAEYLRNFYGAMDDAINGGTETDRMLVHWDLRSDLAVAACAGRWRPASFAAERERGAVVALSAAWGSPAGWRSAARPIPGADGLALAAAYAACRRARGHRGDAADRSRAAPAAWRTALRDALAPLMAAAAR